LSSSRLKDYKNGSSRHPPPATCRISVAHGTAHLPYSMSCPTHHKVGVKQRRMGIQPTMASNWANTSCSLQTWDFLGEASFLG
ncbi:hypothetical protein CY34DRAFT_813512, partial [Suillus luteus UH-Slu-Lm8-n1]